VGSPAQRPARRAPETFPRRGSRIPRSWQSASCRQRLRLCRVKSSPTGFDSPLYGIVPILASVARYAGCSRCTPSQRRGNVRRVKRRSTTMGRLCIKVWSIAATSVISNSPQTSSPRSWSSHRCHPSLPTETERRRVALYGQKSDQSCDAREISSLARPAASDSSPTCAWRIDRSRAFRGLRRAGGEFVIVYQGHSNEPGWRHSAESEAVARISRRFAQGGNTQRPRRNRPSCPAAGVAQIRQAAMGVW
jgi:hypothetical protein